MTIAHTIHDYIVDATNINILNGLTLVKWGKSTRKIKMPPKGCIKSSPLRLQFLKRPTFHRKLALILANIANATMIKVENFFLKSAIDMGEGEFNIKAAYTAARKTSTYAVNASGQ